MLKKILCIMAMLLLPMSAWAGAVWEKQGSFYYLTKENRGNFSLEGAGPNIFPRKYLKYDGVDFLVRGAADWKDYGRLNLEGNNTFTLPIQAGMKVDEVHFLAGGSYSNSYEHDALMRLFGDKYFYGSLTLIFIYQDGVYKEFSVPVFWDWFHLRPGAWSKDGASINYLGDNPVRKDCSMFHVSFVNPRPLEPVKDILLSDSWLGDRPFSDVFAVTVKSSDKLEAMPKVER